MPEHLDITKTQRDKIMALYIKGESPLAIANQLKHLGLSAKQISTMAYRENWRPLRIQHLTEKENDPEALLSIVRRENAQQFAAIIDDVFQDAMNDQHKLSRSGWGLVEDAAGASSPSSAVFSEKQLFSAY